MSFSGDPERFSSATKLGFLDGDDGGSGGFLETDGSTARFNFSSFPDKEETSPIPVRPETSLEDSLMVDSTTGVVLTMLRAPDFLRSVLERGSPKALPERMEEMRSSRAPASFAMILSDVGSLLVKMTPSLFWRRLSSRSYCSY